MQPDDPTIAMAPIHPPDCCSARRPAAARSPGHSSRPSVLDMDALLRRCMGDREFAERIIVKFKTRMVDDLEQLDASIRSGDALATARLAHSLKGATATLSAEGLQAIFARLENIGRSGNVAEATQCLAELKEEWLRFLEYTQGADAACTRPG